MLDFEAKVQQLEKDALDYINADALLKEAAEVIAPPLNDKELRVNNRLKEVPGLVVAHGLGTGKTRTSIQVANQLKQPTNVVVPAALQDNYKKELNKWLGTEPNYLNIQSQQRVGRTGLEPNNNGLLVVDEAHRARERSSKL